MLKYVMLSVDDGDDHQLCSTKRSENELFDRIRLTFIIIIFEDAGKASLL